MIRCFPVLTAVLSLLQHVSADIAPEVTTIQEGYNIVAKVPCSGCPFLYQDTSRGSNEPWAERKDSNALLLNISLPYDSAYLTINNALISPNQRTLPQIYANQVLLDISVADLSSVIDSDQLEGSHSAGGFFGLSYRHSLRSIKGTPALLFQFDIIELWSDLPETPILHKLDSPDQKMLEVILFEKPLLSALSPPGFEILKVELVSRSHNPVAPTSPQQTMHFLDWDSNGRKGTATHALTSFGVWFLDFLDRGLWAMLVFIMALLALFVVVCVFCIFGWSFWQDDYEKAQHGKRTRGRTDIEAAIRMPFKSAEQLGLSRGKVVGIGKGD